MLDTKYLAISHCGDLWGQLSHWPRIVWLRAGGLNPNRHTVEFRMFSHEDRASLMVALENMVEFFQEVGKIIESKGIRDEDPFRRIRADGSLRAKIPDFDD